MGKDSILSEKLSADEAWDIGASLLLDHSEKHREIREIRDVVRQRLEPQKVMDGKYLITARGAVGWAIVTQMMSYFEPTVRNVSVYPRKRTNAESTRADMLRGWLVASSETVNRQSNFVEAQALYNGIETGEMILGAAFDGFRARQGKFPIEVFAPDPECCAWSMSHYGLSYFVSQEVRQASALKVEIGALGKRGKGVVIPEAFDDCDPTQLFEDTRFYTATHEYRWVEGELVYARRHFAGRVPFDIGLFNGVPSELPHERSRGVISPILDLLKGHQQLIDLFVTDAELGHRPLGILFDGKGKFEIVQMEPGSEHEGMSLTPVPYAPNQQLLHEIATMINDQIDMAALPRSSFSGPQFQLSGFALSQFREGLLARLQLLKRHPESALGSHLDLRLRLLKKFCTREMGKIYSKDDVELYLESFNALGDKETKKGAPLEKAWFALSDKDVEDGDTVTVEISPKLPADEAAKVANAQQLLAAGFPFEWVIRYQFNVENADELLKQREFELLLAGDPMFKEAYLAYLLNEFGKSNPQIGKYVVKWMQEQKLLDDERAQNAITQGQTNAGLLGDGGQGALGAGMTPPMEGAMSGEQPPMMPPMEGAGMMSPTEQPPMPMGAPMEGMPPNMAMMQALMGAQQ